MSPISTASNPASPSQGCLAELEQRYFLFSQVCVQLSTRLNALEESSVQQGQTTKQILEDLAHCSQLLSASLNRIEVDELRETLQETCAMMRQILESYARL